MTEIDPVDTQSLPLYAGKFEAIDLLEKTSLRVHEVLERHVYGLLV